MSEPYGYTGEWYEGYINLLHLRARWYSPSEGVFLSRDPVESEPPYQYVRGNPINLKDVLGTFPEALLRDSYGDRMIEFWKRQDKWWWEQLLSAQHGDALISWDKKRVAQFVLDDPLARAYQDIVSIQLPWTECDHPIKSPIRLEGFTEDGRFWSVTSPILTEVWRQNTGSFYYPALHPNDPTWAQFYPQYPNLHSQMSQSLIFWIYYASLQPRLSHMAQNYATYLDASAAFTSLGSTAAIDIFGVITMGSGPEGLAVYGGTDVKVSQVVQFSDVSLGARSLVLTGLSDYLGGYTTFGNGRVRIGEATVHTSVSFLEGLIPETHVQSYANVKQFLYDLGLDSWIDIEPQYDIKAIEVDY